MLVIKNDIKKHRKVSRSYRLIRPIMMLCTTRDCSRPAVHYYTHHHHPPLDNGAKCIIRREDENHCHFWYCEKHKNEFDYGIPQDCKEPSDYAALHTCFPDPDISGR